jgi:TetR/AcrR family transcriptional regulator, cholesterol catabolism regulator
VPRATTEKVTKSAAAGKSKRVKRQAEVTAAAVEVFWAKGYPAASIQDVADRVGVLKGSLYYYIDSKEDLLWRAIDEVHQEWSKILGAATALEADPLAQIHAFIKLHVEWYLANVKEITVFFREWQHLSGDRLKTIKQRRREYEKVIRDLITSAQQSGHMAAELDITYTTRYVLAAVNAVPDWYRVSAADSTQIAEAYADMTGRLLAAHDERNS